MDALETRTGQEEELKERLERGEILSPSEIETVSGIRAAENVQTKPVKLEDLLRTGPVKDKEGKETPYVREVKQIGIGGFGITYLTTTTDTSKKTDDPLRTRHRIIKIGKPAGGNPWQAAQQGIKAEYLNQQELRKFRETFVTELANEEAELKNERKKDAANRDSAKVKTLEERIAKAKRYIDALSAVPETFGEVLADNRNPAEYDRRIITNNIIPVSQFTAINKLPEGVLAYAQDFIQGSTLDSLVKGEAGEFSEQEMNDALMQLDNIVSVLHELGHYHRDIKPDNIMIVRENGKVKVKLIDYGIMTRNQDLQLEDEARYHIGRAIIKMKFYQVSAERAFTAGNSVKGFEYMRKAMDALNEVRKVPGEGSVASEELTRIKLSPLRFVIFEKKHFRNIIQTKASEVIRTALANNINEAEKQEIISEIYDAFGTDLPEMLDYILRSEKDPIKKQALVNELTKLSEKFDAKLKASVADVIKDANKDLEKARFGEQATQMPVIDFDKTETPILARDSDNTAIVTPEDVRAAKERDGEIIAAEKAAEKSTSDFLLANNRQDKCSKCLVLIGRIRTLIEQGKLDEARKLIQAEIDKPGDIDKITEGTSQSFIEIAAQDYDKAIKGLELALNDIKEGEAGAAELRTTLNDLKGKVEIARDAAKLQGSAVKVRAAVEIRAQIADIESQIKIADDEIQRLNAEFESAQVQADSPTATIKEKLDALKKVRETLDEIQDATSKKAELRKKLDALRIELYLSVEQAEQKKKQEEQARQQEAVRIAGELAIARDNVAQAEAKARRIAELQKEFARIDSDKKILTEEKFVKKFEAIDARIKQAENALEMKAAEELKAMKDALSIGMEADLRKKLEENPNVDVSLETTRALDKVLKELGNKAKDDVAQAKAKADDAVNIQKLDAKALNERIKTIENELSDLKIKVPELEAELNVRIKATKDADRSTDELRLTKDLEEQTSQELKEGRARKAALEKERLQLAELKKTVEEKKEADQKAATKKSSANVIEFFSLGKKYKFDPSDRAAALLLLDSPNTILRASLLAAIRSSNLENTLSAEFGDLEERLSSKYIRDAVASEKTMNKNPRINTESFSLAGENIPLEDFEQEGGKEQKDILEREGVLLGGDAIHTSTRTDDSLELIMYDGQNHGVYASIAKAEAYRIIQEGKAKGKSIEEIMLEINDHFAAKEERLPFRYLKVSKDGSLEAYIMGDNPTFIVDNGGNVRLIKSNNPILGLYPQNNPIFSRLFSGGIKPTKDKLNPGEKVISLTDGIIELENAAGEKFGNERVKKVLEKYPGLNAEQLILKIKEEAVKFVHGREILFKDAAEVDKMLKEIADDDITISAFEYKGDDSSQQTPQQTQGAAAKVEAPSNVKDGAKAKSTSTLDSLLDRETAADRNARLKRLSESPLKRTARSLLEVLFGTSNRHLIKTSSAFIGIMCLTYTSEQCEEAKAEQRRYLEQFEEAKKKIVQSSLKQDMKDLLVAEIKYGNLQPIKLDDAMLAAIEKAKDENEARNVLSVLFGDAIVVNAIIGNKAAKENVVKEIKESGLEEKVEDKSIIKDEISASEPDTVEKMPEQIDRDTIFDLLKDNEPAIKRSKFSPYAGPLVGLYIDNNGQKILAKGFEIRGVTEDTSHAYWIDDDGFFDVSDRIEKLNRGIKLATAEDYSGIKPRDEAILVLSSKPLTKADYEKGVDSAAKIQLGEAYKAGLIRGDFYKLTWGTPSQSQILQSKLNYLEQNDEHLPSDDKKKIFLEDSELRTEFIRDVYDYVGRNIISGKGQQDINLVAQEEKTDEARTTVEAYKRMLSVVNNPTTQKAAEADSYNLDHIRQAITQEVTSIEETYLAAEK